MVQKKTRPLHWCMRPSMEWALWITTNTYKLLHLRKKEIKVCCDRQDSTCEGLALLHQSCVWHYYSQSGHFTLVNYSIARFWKYMFSLWLVCHWIMHYFKPHHFLHILKNVTYFYNSPGVFWMRVEVCKAVPLSIRAWSSVGVVHLWNTGTVLLG